GAAMNLQAPPNLSDPDYPRLVDAGINDWGGVSPVTIDHVNPEAPWPRLADLSRRTAERGHILRERLAVYPGYALRPDPWLSGKMQEPVRLLAGEDGLAAEGRAPSRVPWQDPEVTWKPRTIALTFAKSANAGLRADADGRYRAVDYPAATRAWEARARTAPERLDAEIRAALRVAADGRPDAISDEGALALFQAEGPALEALTAVADDLRREAVGDEVTYVVNRNIN